MSTCLFQQELLLKSKNLCSGNSSLQEANQTSRGVQVDKQLACASTGFWFVGYRFSCLWSKEYVGFFYMTTSPSFSQQHNLSQQHIPCKLLPVLLQRGDSEKFQTQTAHLQSQLKHRAGVMRKACLKAHSTHQDPVYHNKQTWCQAQLQYQQAQLQYSIIGTV